MGLGRTGRFLAAEHWGLEPDLVTIAKSLSGGYVPIGACLMRREVRGLGLMWAIEFGEPESRRRSWRLLERAQPGLFAQLVVVPLFSEHAILCQVAGHRMNVVKALPPLVVVEEDVELFARALDEVLARAERLPRAMMGFALRAARAGVAAGR